MGKQEPDSNEVNIAVTTASGQTYKMGSLALEERAMAVESRRQAFQHEVDPLFFKWQAGEGTEQAWLDARTAVQARFPYPTA